jgi:putative heme-binding domain-containing protein
MRRVSSSTALVAVLLLTGMNLHAADVSYLRNSKPLSPRDEKATLALPKGFRVELVASEPDVVDVSADAKRLPSTLEGVVVQMGAELLSALPNKSRVQLLIDSIDPSRGVDLRYLSYEVTTRRGQVLTGMSASETASSLTLPRGEGAEDTILRSQIESVVSSGLSLMP